MTKQSKTGEYDKSQANAGTDKTADSKIPDANAPEQGSDKEKEIIELRQSIGELTGTLQHLQAEFENYRKRCDRENENFIKLANEELIADLLPVLDNLELALKSQNHSESLNKGMQLIYSQFLSALESYGLKKIEAKGTKFDPYFHEALIVDETDDAPNSVIEELQKGYMLYEKVLRHSKVRISKAKSQKKDTGEDKKVNEKKEEKD